MASENIDRLMTPAEMKRRGLPVQPGTIGWLNISDEGTFIGLWIGKKAGVPVTTEKA